MKHDLGECTVNEVVVNNVDEVEGFFALLKEVDWFLVSCFVTFFVDFYFVDCGPDVDKGC